MDIYESLLTNFATLILALIAYKSGLLGFLINGKFMNGKKTPDKRLEELQLEVGNMKDNHLHEVKDSLEEIKKNQVEVLLLLKEIKEYGIRIRKE